MSTRQLPSIGVHFHQLVDVILLLDEDVGARVVLGGKRVLEQVVGQVDRHVALGAEYYISRRRIYE